MKELAKTFSVESFHYDKPAGIHKSFIFSTPQQQLELLSHIPKLNELHDKWRNLQNTSPILKTNSDGSYKTDFFKNYEVIKFN